MCTFNVFWSNLAPVPSLPISPLDTTFSTKLRVFFLSLSNPLIGFGASSMSTSVGSSTGAWVTARGAITLKKTGSPCGPAAIQLPIKRWVGFCEPRPFVLEQAPPLRAGVLAGRISEVASNRVCCESTCAMATVMSSKYCLVANVYSSLWFLQSFRTARPEITEIFPNHRRMSCTRHHI